MDRRERRLHKRKVRRVGVAVASVALLGASLGLGGIAAAANGGGGGGIGGGSGVGGGGSGGLIPSREPGTGSGFNVQNRNGTSYCNGHTALFDGAPAHQVCE